MRLRSVIGALLALMIGGPVAAATDAESRPAPRAQGGVALLESMEASGLGWVARIESVERLDTRGYRAAVSVESVLGSSERPDGPVSIAWEELSTERAVRFEPGDRTLLALEPLSNASIWRARIPDAETREQTAAVAAHGEAFLRNPSLGTVDVLHHYLSLGASRRNTQTGVGHLVTLAAKARPPLARDAARRLAAVPGLAEQLTPASARGLVAALARGDLDAPFEALWRPTLETGRGDTLAAALEQAVQAARPDHPAPRVLEALGVTEGGLPDETVATLRDDPDLRYREVAARTARDPTALQQMGRSDPAPGVRSDALRRLAAIGGPDALPTLLAALADTDASVRSVAAWASAAQGDAAIPGLRAVAYGEYEACAGSADAQHSAIAALSLAGSSGRKTLAEIAASHPDDSLRRLASIALGSFDTHAH